MTTAFDTGWLARSGGRLTWRDRASLIAGMFGAVREGFRLRRHARRGGGRAPALDRFAPPDTPMVNAARAHLLASSGPPMANHCVRTAYWTCLVLEQHAELTPVELETTWVAALLHDVGLERPPPSGDFSLAGIEAVKTLAHATGWPDDQVHFASEAIAVNLSARVDRARSGVVAWAMNVGGLGEIGFPLHRAQMHPDRIAELERSYPRTELWPTVKRLIADEARRVPGGRFGLFRFVFPFIVKR